MKKQVILMVALIAALHSIAQPNPESIDSIVQYHHDHGGFEGVVIVAFEGKPVYRGAFGWANRFEKHLLKKEDRFKIASITKKFTAIRIMQLYESGNLGLNSSIASFLPDMSIKGDKKITVKDLLMHTSGLPSERDIDYVRYDSPSKMLVSVLSRIGDYGELGKFNYNNIDYLLLGYIIESITGRSWQDNIEKHILEPLQMKETGFLRGTGQEDDVVSGHILKQGGKPRAEPEYFIENYFAAGAMYSTANDLLKLDYGLSSNLLMSEESKDLMYQSHPELGYVALGSWVYNYPFVTSQPRVIERRGGLPGFNHVYLRLPDSGIMIIILSNNNLFNPDTFGDSENLKEQLLRLVGGA